ncbi:phosphotransferase [Micromonospora chersina]|uniref:phosphotransferase n=1 Tax=Micromonospora chersina TaxID=47854 RepID=UPI0033AAE924
MHREVSRLRWAVRFTPVPRVLDHGADATGAWLVTAGLPGETVVSDRWKAEPRAAVTAIGRGLHAFHDQLPVDICPYSWDAEGRVAGVKELDAAGRLDTTRWDRVHSVLSRVDALARLDDVPETDRLVVCHGDACAPNTLLNEDGTWSEHVDLRPVS